MLFTNMKSLNAFQMTRKSSNVLGWSWMILRGHYKSLRTSVAKRYVVGVDDGDFL